MIYNQRFTLNSRSLHRMLTRASSTMFPLPPADAPHNILLANGILWIRLLMRKQSGSTMSTTMANLSRGYIPVLAKEHQRAETHTHDQERFPHGHHQRLPVEPTQKVIQRSCCQAEHHKGDRHNHRDECDQRPVSSHSWSELDEPVTAIGDAPKHKEAEILGK